MQQKHEESKREFAPESWQKMLATLSKLNRDAIEANREQDNNRKKQQEEAA